MKCYFILYLTDSTNISPLLVASKTGNLEITEALLQFNPDLNIDGLVTVGPELRKLNPFQCAVVMGHLDIAKLLVNAGYHVTQETILWTNENVADSLLLNTEFWSWLREVVSEPLSLLEMCRRYLKALLGFQIRRHVSSLPIPPLLRSFLTNV